MKYMAATALGAAVLLASILPASAAVLTVRQVLTQCPDIAAARACPAVATEFLASRAPGPASDAQIVNLVVALAEAGQTPKVPMPVCLNVADGLRVLAGGVSNAGQAQQIRDIADALCQNVTTAAIGDDAPAGGGGGPGPFGSLAGPG